MVEHSTLRLRKETHQAIKAIAASKGMTMTKFLDFYVKDHQEAEKQKLAKELQK